MLTTSSMSTMKVSASGLNCVLQDKELQEMHTTQIGRRPGGKGTKAKVDGHRRGQRGCRELAFLELPHCYREALGHMRHRLAHRDACGQFLCVHGSPSTSLRFPEVWRSLIRWASDREGLVRQQSLYNFVESAVVAQYGLRCLENSCSAPMPTCSKTVASKYRKHVRHKVGTPKRLDPFDYL